MRIIYDNKECAIFKIVIQASNNINAKSYVDLTERHTGADQAKAQNKLGIKITARTSLSHR